MAVEWNGHPHMIISLGIVSLDFVRVGPGEIFISRNKTLLLSMTTELVLLSHPAGCNIFSA